VEVISHSHGVGGLFPFRKNCTDIDVFGLTFLKGIIT
jgi:hypothetical protein